MNTENLNKIIEMLEQTDPSEFDMKETVNPERKTYCIMGLAYKKLNLVDFIGFKQFVGISNCTGLFPSTDSELNKLQYIIFYKWGSHPVTNTIENAIHRIQKLIAGYEPTDIDTEIEKELQDINS